LAEVARVLKPGGHIVFSDWIARAAYTDDDAALLRSLWSFPSLWTLGDYASALERAGFELLLVEERAGMLPAPPEEPADQSLWEARFAARWGEAELERQRAPARAWRSMLRAGHTGFGAFAARREP
jgi:SAM-dependent methyltransferase